MRSDSHPKRLDDKQKGQTILQLKPNPNETLDRDERPSLLVFSDDWGRHPSSCQHLISRLLGDYEVTWVNTIGMRPPTFDWATVGRVWEKLGHWSTRPRRADAPDHAAPQVISPRMWPWFRRRHDRWLNRKLLTRQVNRHLRRVRKPTVAITTIPIVADLMAILDVDAWVYYCVDDFSLWPGLDQSTMAAMETEVMERCDACVAASAVLQERIGQFRSDVELLTHGVDLAHWERSRPPSRQQPGEEVSAVATFWGLVDQRLDLEILRALSTHFHGQVTLIGPQASPDPHLASLAVDLRPAVPYDELPQVAAATDVLIMPYADLPVTRAMQPLKLLEYLATGKPVVVPHLPATLPWGDCLDIAKTPSEFVTFVAQRAKDGLPDAQRQARKRLAEEDWSSKAKLFDLFIRSVVGSQTSATDLEVR